MDTQKTPFRKAVIEILQGSQIRVLVLVTCLTRVGNLRILNGVFGQQGYKHMGMGVTGFRASGNAGHVTTDTIGKRMNGMSHVFINYFMTHHALLGAGPLGLELSWGYTQLMHVMTRRAGNTFLGMG